MTTALQIDPRASLTAHPAASIFPMLQGDEADQLANDILANGLRQPIVLHPDGSILDGRNRYAACLKVGIEPKFVTWNNHNGADSAVKYVLSLNLKRRHLTPSQCAVVALDVLPALKAEAKERQGTRTDLDNITQRIVESSRSDRESAQYAAKLTGTNRTYVAEAMRLQAESPELLEQVRLGKKEMSAVIKERKTTDRLERLDSRKTGVIPANVFHSAIENGLPQIPDSSVDAIVTDPPYKKEFLSVYSELSKVAARVLKPGAPCLVMTGQSWLEEVLHRLAEHLDYQWIAYSVDFE